MIVQLGNFLGNSGS